MRLLVSCARLLEFEKKLTDVTGRGRRGGGLVKSCISVTRITCLRASVTHHRVKLTVVALCRSGRLKRMKNSLDPPVPTGSCQCSSKNQVTVRRGWAGPGGRLYITTAPGTPRRKNTGHRLGETGDAAVLRHECGRARKTLNLNP